MSMGSPPPPPAVATAVSDDSGLEKQSSNEDARVKLKLEDLNWDHSFVCELPGNPRTDIISREVLHAWYSKVSPSVEVENPQLVAWSESVADILDG